MMQEGLRCKRRLETRGIEGRVGESDDTEPVGENRAWQKGYGGNNQRLISGGVWLAWLVWLAE